MADSNRLQKVTFHCSYPTILENIDTLWKSKQFGIYYISRVFNGIESPIYIGETKRDFITKINEHYETVSDFFNKRGLKKIRLGTLVKPQTLSFYKEDDKEIKHLLQVIESRLVEYPFNNNYGKTLYNKRQVVTYSEWYKVNIENIGFRGFLPKYFPY